MTAELQGRKTINESHFWLKKKQQQQQQKNKKRERKERGKRASFARSRSSVTRLKIHLRCCFT